MPDCIVIGGGVIGMMTARELTLKGIEVTLLEKGTCGKESSWAGGGIISPLYPWEYSDEVNSFSFASQEVYEGLCHELLDSTGIDPEFYRCGLLMLDQFEQDNAKTWLKKYQVSYQDIDDKALFENIAQIRNPRLVKALKKDIELRGVKVIENANVSDLLIDADAIKGVKYNEVSLYSENVVLSAGAWSGEFAQTPKEVFPMKGQMIVIQAKPKEVEHIILGEGRYIIPRRDGNVVVGSTMQEVGFDRSTEDIIRDELYDFAIKYQPQLSKYPVKYHWSGFRPATRDNEVIVKKSDEIEGLYFNTGHFRNGLNMAPACAKKIANLIQ